MGLDAKFPLLSELKIQEQSGLHIFVWLDMRKSLVR